VFAFSQGNSEVAPAVQAAARSNVHSTAQHSTATAQYSTAQHSTAQHSTAQHSTATAQYSNM